MKALPRYLGFASLILAASACGGSDESNDPSGADAGQAGDDADAPFRLDLVTFNMALTTTVKGPEERLPGIVTELGAQDADVLCLQEAFIGVRTPAEVAALLQDTYPHSYFSDVPAEFPWGAGIVLVSKHPLEQTASLRFVNEDQFGVVDRSVISADIALDGRTFRVACTHLSAGLDADGVALRGRQVDELVAWLGEKAEVDGPTFLLGDFNAGPDPIGACTPSTDPACELPDTTSYDRVLESFDDPNADLAECTQCREQFASLQTLTLFSTEPDQRIDHCFVRDLSPYRHLESGIVLDGEVSIPFEGETLTHLSDHRGVRCSFGSE